MFDSSALLLIAAVATVGVLHTAVPDHWAPITLVARQHGWGPAETARASLQAGAGHVFSTLVIALLVWFAGAAAAEQYGHIVDTATSLALIAFGGWFAITAWRQLRRHRHGHVHRHSHHHGGHARPPVQQMHDPESWRFDVRHDAMRAAFDWTAATEREAHGHDHHGADHNAGRYGPPDLDELYAPLAATMAIRHCHPHRHSEKAPPHIHWHDHAAAEAHSSEIDAPLHQHRHKTTGRTALLLILGSSPMVEGIPVFFAAQHYGVQLLLVLAIVFAASTIGTYVLLCVCSTAGLQRIRLGPLERYGEVLSGGLVAVLGLVFLIWPAL